MADHQAHRRSALGNHHMIHIHRVHDENVEAKNDHKCWLLLHVRPKQGEERKSEMHEDEGKADQVPVLSVTEKEVAGLLDDIGIPDEEELGEGNVGPENREGKTELTHDVIVLLGHHLIEITGFLKKDPGENENRH